MNLADAPTFPPRSALLALLDRETQSHHATADVDLFRVLDDVTPDAFRQFLAAVYHFEHAIEARLALIDELPRELVARRAKTSRLLDDLLALGSDRRVLELLSRPLDLPELRGAPEALGWMYVLQRNTLRHGALLRALAPRLCATVRLATRYLTTHSGDVYERWHELGVFLDRAIGDDDAAGQRTITAARDAFERQHRWYVDSAVRRTLGTASIYAMR